MKCQNIYFFKTVEFNCVSENIYFQISKIMGFGITEKTVHMYCNVEIYPTEKTFLSL